MSQIKQNIKNHLINIPGWRTNRKIIVFESDDWGMIRMQSKEAQREFQEKGYQIQDCAYNLNDRLESDLDIQLLGEVLLKTKDSKGNPAKFTINNVVGNPYFEKIKKADFQKYYFEPFTKTYDQYNDSQNVMTLYREGIANNIFQPQLHGREHINLRLWMKRLQEGNAITMHAFERNMFTLHHSGPISGRRDNIDTFGNTTTKNENFDYAQDITDAQQIFENIWGFKSKSFIAPCYVWHPSLEPILAREGIKFIQGTYVQRMPVDNETFKVKRKYHYMGEKNKLDQRYLIRNCFFEPTEMGRTNSVEMVLKEIELAFTYKKPAIISSHRVNYIGTLKPENRNGNLKLLKKLLAEITSRWPEVEFMSTDQVGTLIEKQK